MKPSVLSSVAAAVILAAVANTSEASASAAIPNHCKAPDMAEIVSRGVPEILEIEPGDASIDSVSFLADVPKVVSYPAVGSMPARHMIKCSVKLTWSNGREQYGTFFMWEDTYDQVMMSFDH